jgi:hypothetical protein
MSEEINIKQIVKPDTEQEELHIKVLILEGPSIPFKKKVKNSLLKQWYEYLTCQTKVLP